MTDLIGRTLHRLGERLPGRVSVPGDKGYTAATAIWARPAGCMPRAVVHCQSSADVQATIRAARDCDLPLSVRGGGHDWAGRALCEGIVIDLRGMNAVTVDPGGSAVRVSGGARASYRIRLIESPQAGDSHRESKRLYGGVMILLRGQDHDGDSIAFERGRAGGTV